MTKKAKFYRYVSLVMSYKPYHVSIIPKVYRDTKAMVSWCACLGWYRTALIGILLHSTLVLLISVSTMCGLFHHWHWAWQVHYTCPCGPWEWLKQITTKGFLLKLSIKTNLYVRRANCKNPGHFSYGRLLKIFSSNFSRGKPSLIISY